MKKCFKIFVLIAFLLLGNKTLFSQGETYEVQGFTESLFAKNLFHFQLNDITAKIPHLKTINLSFDLAQWYWTTVPSVARATTAINVDIGKVIYNDFVMILPNGAEKRVSFEEIGIVSNTNPTICDIKLEILISKFDIKTTTEIDLNIYGKGSGSVSFSNDTEAFNEVFKFDQNKKRYKTIKELFNELEPQVKLIHNGSYNCSIGGFESNFYLKAIRKYIEKEHEEVSMRMKLTNLMADAQNAESLGRIDDAILKYQEVLKLNSTPEIRAKIDELKAEKELADKEQKSSDGALTSTNENVNENVRDEKAVDTFDHTIKKEPLSTTRDFWGNPIVSNSESEGQSSVQGNNINNNTYYQEQVNKQKNDAYLQSQFERKEAEKRAQIDANNNEIYRQANAIYNNSVDIESSFNEATKQLNYASGDALIKSSLALSNSATNVAQAQMGAIGFGIGVLTKIGENSAKREAIRKANEERERQQLLKEAQIKKAKEEMKKGRLSVFNAFPDGTLPSSSSKSIGENLYYFVYSYDKNKLTEQNPTLWLSNIFAIGKYPDNTWPLQTKITEDIYNLTPLNEIICGPFYTKSEADDVLSSFKNYLTQTLMTSNLIEYNGFNAHKESENTSQTTTSKLDFWGNPIKN